MSFMVRIWLSVLIVATGGYAVLAIYRQAKYEHDFAPAAPTQVELLPDGIPQVSFAEVADTKLVERSGRAFRFGELEGQVWIGSFFFSSCPGPCRQINIALAGLQTELADKPVRFVSITVDPENDTPEALQRYAASFNADADRWLFLTGDFASIKDLCQRYFQMPVDKKVHTERLMLVDRQGKSHGAFNTGRENEMRALRAELDKVLSEPVSGEKSDGKVNLARPEAVPQVAEKNGE